MRYWRCWAIGVSCRSQAASINAARDAKWYVIADWLCCPAAATISRFGTPSPRVANSCSAAASRRSRPCAGRPGAAPRDARVPVGEGLVTYLNITLNIEQELSRQVKSRRRARKPGIAVAVLQGKGDDAGLSP